MTGKLIQGSDEWLAARVGKVTASRIADLTAKTKSGWGAGRKNYMAELIAERLTGAAANNFTNSAMQWGTETEPLARSAYEFETDLDVVEVGLVSHPTIKNSAASPDGLVNEDGGVEIKCPNTATHIDTLLNEKIPDKYIKQMQWQMACTGRRWCDFVSFDPRLGARLSLFIKRVARDDKLIIELEMAVVAFIQEMEQKIIELNGLGSDG